MRSLQHHCPSLSKWILRGLTCLFLFLGTDAWSATVMESYSRALKLYGQGQLRTAFQTLVATIKKYPDHQPSYLLAGQIMYRMGKMDRAARFFRKVPPDFLSGDAAYMYGVSFFTIGNCKNAEAGFSRVGVGSPAAKVAAFYRGICFARERQWLSAEKQLIASTPLPPHLETVRRRALEQVRNALNAERQAPPLTNTPFIYAQPPPPLPVIAASTPPMPSDGAPPSSIYQPKKKLPPVPLPSAGFTGAVTPNAESSVAKFLRDYSGYRQEQGENQTILGKVALLGRYNAESNASGGQPYVSIGGDASLKSVRTKGVATTLEAFSNAPQDGSISTSALPPGKTDTQDFNVNPEASYPVFGLVDVTVGGRWAKTTLKGTVNDDYTRQEGYGSLAFGVQTQLKATAAMIQKINIKGKNTENISQFGGQITHIVGPATLTASGQYAMRDLTTKPPPGAVILLETASSTFDGSIISVDGSARKNWETFSITGAGSFKQYETASLNNKKLFEDQLIKVELSAVKNWDIGITLTVTGTVFMLEEYKLEVEAPADTTEPVITLDETGDPKPAKKIVSNSVERTKGLVSLKYSPLSFISFSVSYDAMKSAISPTDNKLLEVVQKVEPSLLTNVTFLAGIQTTF
jgi:hypothetical protein